MRRSPLLTAALAVALLAGGGLTAAPADEAGEGSAENGGLSGGVRQQAFTASFSLRRTTPEHRRLLVGRFP